MSEIETRRALADQAPALSAPVPEVFEAFVAPHSGAEARVTFGHEAAPEAMAARWATRWATRWVEGRTALAACAAESRGLVGDIEIEGSHIRELFVTGPWATINGLTVHPMVRRPGRAPMP